MNFFQFLKSLDNLLYEVASWLVFYPVTMWRSARHPLAMMDYGAAELGQPVELQYDEALSPPILLLLTVIFAHAIELALIGESKLVTDTAGLAGIIDDDTSLIMLRIVAFATFPLIFATHTLRRLKVPLTRSALEPQFFAQCYANAPFALLVSVAVTLWQVPDDGVRLLALAIFAVSVAGFLAIETAWFRKVLAVGLARGLWNALIAWAQAIAFMLLLGWLLGGADW
jgi:hypothetical protein